MASECLGALSCGYARNILPAKNEIVWVCRSYNPKEPRRTSMVPVSRHKLVTVYPSEKSSIVPDEWKLQVEPPDFSFSRWSEEKYHYPSSPATRCEKWSTLRQSLPSRERTFMGNSGAWGTGPPYLRRNQAEKKLSASWPHTNSIMTRYA